MKSSGDHHQRELERGDHESTSERRSRKSLSPAREDAEAGEARGRQREQLDVLELGNDRRLGARPRSGWPGRRRRASASLPAGRSRPRRPRRRARARTSIAAVRRETRGRGARTGRPARCRTPRRPCRHPPSPPAASRRTRSPALPRPSAGRADSGAGTTRRSRRRRCTGHRPTRAGRPGARPGARPRARRPTEAAAAAAARAAASGTPHDAWRGSACCEMRRHCRRHWLAPSSGPLARRSRRRNHRGGTQSRRLRTTLARSQAESEQPVSYPNPGSPAARIELARAG